MEPLLFVGVFVLCLFIPILLIVIAKKSAGSKTNDGKYVLPSYLAGMKPDQDPGRNHDVDILLSSLNRLNEQKIADEISRRLDPVLNDIQQACLFGSDDPRNLYRSFNEMISRGKK